MSGLLELKLQQDTCGWRVYKLKCHKRGEVMYLEASKQQRRYRLTHLELSRLEEKYGWCFEDESTGWETDGTFLGVENKQ